MKAEIGDRADFKLLNEDRILGVIFHIPQATGDSWVIEEEFEGKASGVFYYIQNFSWMRLLKSDNTKE
jgi:hypothetical protein